METAPPWLWPLCWGRRFSAAFAGVVFDYLDADTMLTPLRRLVNQTRSAAGVASGGTLPPTARPQPPGAIFPKDHQTTDHRCPVEGFRVGRSHQCAHGITKCANCGGPHGARADAGALKREARRIARGGNLPLLPQRERGGAQSPPEAPVSETTTIQGGKVSGEAEVEVEEREGSTQVAEEIKAGE